MKKFQILTVALFAVLAFGAVAASSAMAVEFRCIKTNNEGLWPTEASLTECTGVQLGSANSPFELVAYLPAEWLVGAKAVETTLLVESTGTLLLEDKKATLGVKAMVLCSGILVGTIGKEGEGEVTEVLSLSGTAIPRKALEGTGLLCSGQEGCTTGTENDEVWAVNLPWTSLLDLIEEESPAAFVGFGNLLRARTGAGPGWYTLCATALGTSEDECTAEEAGSEASNLTGGVDDQFSPTFTNLMDQVLGNCSASSEKETGVVEGPGETTVAGSSEVLGISSVG